MNDSDANHQIQSQPDFESRSNVSDGVADVLPARDTACESEDQPRTLRVGKLFGAAVGLPAGAVAAAACCWLSGMFDYFWHGVLIGTLFGPLVGALIGTMERKVRGDLAKPDVATLICLVFALLPALILLLQGLNLVVGEFSLVLLVGASSAGPMIGLLIGAVFDRALEAATKKAWGGTVLYGVGGFAGCIALVFVIDMLAYGPDPAEVVRETRALILSTWRDQPGGHDATIQNLTLVRAGRRTYTGVVDATFAGQPGRLTVEVLIEGGHISLHMKPMNELFK